VLNTIVGAYDRGGCRHWRCRSRVCPVVVRRRHHRADEAGRPGRTVGPARDRRALADRGSGRQLRDGVRWELAPCNTNRPLPPAGC